MKTGKRERNEDEKQTESDGNNPMCRCSDVVGTVLASFCEWSRRRQPGGYEAQVQEG